jgi:cytochrome oxidase assembly protein ShyY1
MKIVSSEVQNEGQPTEKLLFTWDDSSATSLYKSALVSGNQPEKEQVLYDILKKGVARASRPLWLKILMWIGLILGGLLAVLGAWHLIASRLS